MNNNINVLLSGNEASENIFPTLINSIIKHTDRSVHIKILCRNWKRDNILGDRLKVEFITPQTKVRSPDIKQTSANDKLLALAELTEWNRCLTLGWDQLVVGHLDEYYDTPMEPHQVITATPYGSGRFRDLWRWKNNTAKLESLFDEETLNLSGFSGGSHLIDMDSCRKGGFIERLENALRVLNGEDHQAMIGVFGKNFKPVGKEWNVLCEEMPHITAKILHFNGGNKPWRRGNKKPIWEYFRSDWQELEKKSP